MHEPFAGRVAELAELNRQLELAEDHHGRVVLLTGAVGGGKTALIRQCLPAWARRANVALASGDQDETLIPGGLLGQLVQPAAAAAGITAMLASGRADPLTAGSALLAFARELTSARALVIVVDDAQWGDELSLKAVSFALRRLRGDRVLAVIATRPEGLDRLPPGITRLADDNGVRVHLGGLAVAEIAEVARQVGAGPLTARAAARLHHHTGGVPLHVRELLHDVPGDVLRATGAALPVPRSLDTLVLSRLAACAGDTERLVVAAAVLGADGPLPDLAALAGLADPLPAFQEAIAERLLEERESPGGRRYAFPHALIRAAVYRDIGVSRRAALHRAAAGLTAGPEALAHRAAGCCGGDRQLAVDLAAQAAREQSAGWLAEAAEHLLLAARAADRGGGRDEWLLAAVGLLLDAGDAARARALEGEVTALPPSAQRSLLLGRLAMLTGAYARAERWIADAWVDVKPGPPSGLDRFRESAAQAACELALLLAGQRRLDEAVSWAHRSADTAVSEFTRACSSAVQGGLLASSGHTDRARTLLEAELDRCAGGPAQALLHAGLGATLLHADDLPGAIGHLDAATTTDGVADLPMAHLLQAGLVRVAVWYRIGDWDRAAAEGERLVALIDDLDQQWLLGRAHLAAVYVAAGRGQWQIAAGHAEAAAAHPGVDAITLADARTAIAAARDDPEGVLAAGADVVGDPGLVNRGGLSIWPEYAQALARTGRSAEADETLRRFEEISRARDRRSALAAADRARGVIEATRDRPADALAAFDASLHQLRGLNMPFEEALTRLERGRLLHRLGQPRSAARDVGLARGLFARLAAEPFVLRCDQELCADPGAAADSALPLTSRQLAVARAAAAGKSNREIAAELYISVKTVEFHVAQILARLGADSRKQIAGKLAETPAR